MMQNENFVIHPEATTDLMWNILFVWTRETGWKSFEANYIRRKAGNIANWTGLTMKQVLSILVELLNIAANQCLIEAMNPDHRRRPVEPTLDLERQFGGKQGLTQALWLIMAYRVCHQGVFLNDDAMKVRCNQLNTSLQGQGLKPDLELVEKMLRSLIRQAAA